LRVYKDYVHHEWWTSEARFTTFLDE